MKKNNQGYQRTHEKIKEIVAALIEKQHLEQITVSQICQLAEINRSTFYAHFQDIYDVMVQIQRNHELVIQKMIMQSENIWKSDADTNTRLKTYIILLLHYIQEHRKIYHEIMSHMIELETRGSMEAMHSLIIEPIYQRFSVEKRVGKYYYRFMIAGFLTLILQWLDEGCIEKPGPNETPKIGENRSDIYEKDWNLWNRNYGSVYGTYFCRERI